MKENEASKELEMGNLVLEGNKLEASGRLSIPEAVQLRELLQEARSKAEEVVLDLSGAESLDLACVQVLCAASRSFRKAGKVLRTSGGLPEGVKGSLKEMAVDPKDCGLGSDDDSGVAGDE